MKTLKMAVERANRLGVEDKYMYVKAILMTKIIISRDEPVISRQSSYMSFRIPDYQKYQLN